MTRPLYARSVRRAQGLHSQTDAAESLGINTQTFYQMIYRGVIPRPQAQFCGSNRRYYTAADIEYMRRLLRA